MKDDSFGAETTVENVEVACPVCTRRFPCEVRPTDSWGMGTEQCMQRDVMAHIDMCLARQKLCSR